MKYFHRALAPFVSAPWLECSYPVSSCRPREQAANLAAQPRAEPRHCATRRGLQKRLSAFPKRGKLYLVACRYFGTGLPSRGLCGIAARLNSRKRLDLQSDPVAKANLGGSGSELALSLIELLFGGPKAQKGRRPSGIWGFMGNAAHSRNSAATSWPRTSPDIGQCPSPAESPLKIFAAPARQQNWPNREREQFGFAQTPCPAQGGNNAPHQPHFQQFKWKYQFQWK
jgi:hypothetical protein